MSMNPLLAGLEGVRRNWGWFLVLGIVLILLGCFAIVSPWVATVAAVLTLGWLILFSGVCEAVAAFGARQYGGVLLHLLGAVLSIVVGLLIVAHPVAGAAGLTMLLAAFFLVAGVFRIGAAVALRFPNWGWSVLGGLVTALLGGLIWAEWPSSALWVIGTFVGIELLFRGWGWVMLALAARQFPRAADRPAEWTSAAARATQNL
jgi:uncharacterized membrane protein HdeD (DUF308 family)